MTFKEFKGFVNIIDSCDELERWEFDRILTTFQNVKIKLDLLGTRIDTDLKAIDDKLDA